nr:hypothetical protein [Bacteroides intestinalis]
MYIPSNNDADKGLPVVLLACGHGNNGKLYPAYRKMAEYLASSGIAVLVPDNIGQGERHFMGHYSAPGIHSSFMASDFRTISLISTLSFSNQGKSPGK